MDKTSCKPMSTYLCFTVLEDENIYRRRGRQSMSFDWKHCQMFSWSQVCRRLRQPEPQEESRGAKLPAAYLVRLWLLLLSTRLFYWNFGIWRELHPPYQAIFWIILENLDYIFIRGHQSNLIMYLRDIGSTFMSMVFGEWNYLADLWVRNVIRELKFGNKFKEL